MNKQFCKRDVRTRTQVHITNNTYTGTIKYYNTTIRVAVFTVEAYYNIIYLGTCSNASAAHPPILGWYSVGIRLFLCSVLTVFFLAFRCVFFRHPFETRVPDGKLQ